VTPELLAGLAAVDTLGRVYDAPWDELTAEQQAFCTIVYSVRRRERLDLAKLMAGVGVGGSVKR
jgi:hypothetical protein